MFKRLIVMGITAMLLLAMSAGAVSAASSAKQIRVSLNEKRSFFQRLQSS